MMREKGGRPAGMLVEEMFPLKQSQGSQKPVRSRAGRKPVGRCLPLRSTHKAILLTEQRIYLCLEVKSTGKSNPNVVPVPGIAGGPF